MNQGSKEILLFFRLTGQQNLVPTGFIRQLTKELISAQEHNFREENQRNIKVAAPSKAAKRKEKTNLETKQMTRTAQLYLQLPTDGIYIQQKE